MKGALKWWDNGFFSILAIHYHYTFQFTNLFSLRNCILRNFVTRAGDELRNQGHLGVLYLHVYADGLGADACVHAAIVHDAVEAVGMNDGRR